MPIASNVMTVSAPLATDFSARNSVMRTMIPKNPAAASGQPHRKGRGTPELIERCSPSPVHARCPSTRHKTQSARKQVPAVPDSARTRMVLRTGPFHGEQVGTARPARLHHFSGDVELTFLGHPLESLGRAFDPVLAVIAVGQEQPIALIGAAGGRTRDLAGSEIDGLTTVNLWFNALSITQKRRLSPRSRCRPTENPAAV